MSVDVLLVAGARPNVVKLTPHHRSLPAQARLPSTILHTGQHYEANGRRHRIPALWEGRTGERIAVDLANCLSSRR